MKTRAFAEGTVVSVPKSRAEIEDLLTRYGADGFGYAIEARRAAILFSVAGRKVRFVLPIPAKDDKRFTHKKPRHAWSSPEKRTENQALEAWEQEQRRLWRALALVIKAKLEAVSSGIVTFESEFLAHFVQPDGKTVGETAIPALLTMWETGKQTPLLGGAFD